MGRRQKEDNKENCACAEASRPATLEEPRNERGDAEWRAVQKNKKVWINVMAESGGKERAASVWKGVLLD